MSWDIFVQDLPSNISSVSEIPEDFSPQSLALKRSNVISKICQVAPDADFSNQSWGRISGDGFSIEINLGEEEELDSFALHVRGEGQAHSLIAAILGRLNVRAIDIGSESGLFDPSTSAESFAAWQRFRNTVRDSE